MRQECVVRMDLARSVTLLPCARPPRAVRHGADQRAAITRCAWGGAGARGTRSVKKLGCACVTLACLLLTTVAEPPLSILPTPPQCPVGSQSSARSRRRGDGGSCPDDAGSQMRLRGCGRSAAGGWMRGRDGHVYIDCASCSAGDTRHLTVYSTMSCPLSLCSAVLPSW